MAKGVASLMDTVFLILIAGVASAILFYSASNYGNELRTQADSLILNFYARQVVRVLTTASIQPENCPPDYFLSYLKEKYYNGQLGDPATLEEINSVVYRAMLPLSRSYDYAVVISDGDTAYLFMYYRAVSSGSVSEETKYFVCDQTAFEKWVMDLNGAYGYSTPVFLRSQSGYRAGKIHVFLMQPAINKPPSC